MSRAKRATNAGGQAVLGIDMVEGDVQAEGDGGVFVNEDDEITDAHGTVVVAAGEGALAAG